MLQLPDSDRQLLLKIARQAVEAHLLQRQFHVSAPVGRLSETHALFVSIHQGQDLRGCIGNLHPVASLASTVADCAMSAAIADPRFVPLNADELAKVQFEISVLSPFRNVDDIRTIEPGTHGLLVTKGNARGLLLPQVATEYGWDRERFLAETCRKAGLRPDAWKEGAAVFSFTALVFGELPIDEQAAS